MLLLRRDGDERAVDQAVETAVTNGLCRLDIVEQLLAQATDVRPIMAQADVKDHLRSITVSAMDLTRYDAAAVSKGVSA